MDKLADLRKKLGLISDEMNTEAVLKDIKAFEAKETEFAECQGMISRMERAQTASAALARPVGGVHGAAGDAERQPVERSGNIVLPPPGMSPIGKYRHYLTQVRAKTGFVFDKEKHFRSVGEQLQAIMMASTGVRQTDSRLVRAPLGAGEVDATGGGFLVQVDMAEAIFMLMHDIGEILPRVNNIPISANANGIKINAVDEVSRATGSRWGGVQSYWVDEGTAPPPSRPKFRRVELDLKKLAALMYMTDELLQDSTALGAISGAAFAEEMTVLTELSFFEGTGAGQPLGVLNSPALVTVAKASGQAAGTIVKENIDAMWSRMYAPSRKNAVWFMNQDIEPQLNQMNQAVGTGGQLVYLPPGGIANAPNATLYGRPLITTEYNAALGSPGDILLADWSQYVTISKGGVQTAMSMHVAFLSDQQVFRVIFRIDGRPMWAVPLMPLKGNLTKSPFVALAQR